MMGNNLDSTLIKTIWISVMHTEQIFTLCGHYILQINLKFPFFLFIDLLLQTGLFHNSETFERA